MLPDGVSSAAAIAGLIGFVFHTSHKLYSTFSEVHDAPENVKRLVSSLHAWKTTSAAVKDTIDQCPTVPADTGGTRLDPILEALEVCKGALTEIDIQVEKYEAGRSSSAVKLWKDVKWVFLAEKVKTAQARLDDSRLTLITALSAVGW